MKRFISMSLAIALCMILCSCGGNKSKKAFDASKVAYDNINTAYEIIADFGSDIYEAWRIGIYEKKNLTLSGLAEELNLTEDELKMGFAYMINKDEWDTMTDEEQASEADSAEGDFLLVTMLADSDIFSVCVYTVSSAYKVSGKTSEVQNILDAAKEQMKGLSENYSDYEHYPALKGYYTTTSAFFDFCQNPVGSFDQVKSTVDDYRNSAREYYKDLEFIFED